ncbi:MAG: hypothetical protein K6E54_09680 [Bacteroidaceae bacterium]|nr:hypothetical protein [Bacteroidaceae bacterium]
MALLVALPFSPVKAETTALPEGPSIVVDKAAKGTLVVSYTDRFSITFLKEYTDIVIEVFNKDYELISILSREKVKDGETVVIEPEDIDGVPAEIDIVCGEIVIFSKKIKKETK